jgi:FMN reductase
MLDFRSLIIPRFVYASRDAFKDEFITEEGLKERIRELVLQTHQLSKAIQAHK